MKSRTGGADIDIDGVFRYLGRDLRAVERALVTHLESPVPLIPVVGKHITLSGGKRIRPAVLLLCADACGYRGPRRTVMSVVTEYMHTATLLHDDVVDLGTVRRGKPAANMVFGNSVSILVGDFLFARASQLMTDDGDIDVLGIYARTLVSLTEGEVMQLTRSHDAGITEKQYFDVVYCKTASLIAAASETGAVLAGADPATRKAMYEYGKCVGMAFQLVDDILDYTGTEKQLGKRPFQDLREGKVTLPLLHALREADDAERGRALEALAKKEPGKRDVAFLAGLVARRGGVDYTASRAKGFIRRGKRFLDGLPASAARDALAALSDYVVSRTA
jgi:octaprenyl-diphosphate synthase